MKKEVLKEIRKNLVVGNEKMTDMDCLRENLRRYIDHKDITFIKLADETGISIETLKTLIYGKAEFCSSKTLCALSRALHVTINELFGMMPKKTAIDLATYEDDLPNRSKQEIDWHIQDQKHKLLMYPNEKRIPVMTPEIDSFGNLHYDNIYEYINIDHLDNSILSKVYFGLRIPYNAYEPIFFEGDILLLANDRKATATEKAVIKVRDNIFIVKRKIEDDIVKFYGIRDDVFRSPDTPTIQTMGYIVSVLEGE